MGADNNAHSTNHTLNPNFKIEIIPGPALLDPARRSLLHNLNDLLNDAYATSKAATTVPNNTSQSLFSKSRIRTEDQLVQELGTTGLIAICTDTSLPEFARDTQQWSINLTRGYSPGKYGNVVATAALAPWKGGVVENFLRALAVTKQQQGEATDIVAVADVHAKVFGDSSKSSEATSDWEVKTCASCDDPVYRGKGLITHCIDALIKRFLAELRKSDDGRSHVSATPIKLWLSTREGYNSQYWTRRGFVTERVDVAPIGVWGSIEEFKIVTLTKTIPR